MNTQSDTLDMKRLLLSLDKEELNHFCLGLANAFDASLEMTDDGPKVTISDFEFIGTQMRQRGSAIAHFEVAVTIRDVWDVTSQAYDMLHGNQTVELTMQGRDMLQETPAPVAVPLAGKTWESACCSCGKITVNGCGSTECCGALQEIISLDGVGYDDKGAVVRKTTAQGYSMIGIDLAKPGTEFTAITILPVSCPLPPVPSPPPRKTDLASIIAAAKNVCLLDQKARLADLSVEIDSYSFVSGVVFRRTWQHATQDEAFEIDANGIRTSLGREAFLSTLRYHAGLTGMAPMVPGM